MGSFAAGERSWASGWGFLSECAAVFHPGYAHTLVVNYAGLRAERLPAAMDLLGEVFAE